MKLWCTEIEAKDPFTGQLKKWCGPEVPGICHNDAERYCQDNGLGYCKVTGELVAEIPCKEGTYEPDFKNMIDYENTQNN
jgi:hypothetical protein